MNTKARALALSFATAALVASLPAAAQTPAAGTPPPPAPSPAGYAPAQPGVGQAPPAEYAPAQPAYQGPVSGGYPLPIALPPPIDRQSTTAMVGGIVLVALGGVLSIGSALAFAVPVCNGNEGACRTGSGAPVGLLISGIIGLAAGIPLVVYGSKRVPLTGEATTGRALPAWVGAPRGDGWAWTF